MAGAPPHTPSSWQAELDSGGGGAIAAAGAAGGGSDEEISSDDGGPPGLADMAAHALLQLPDQRGTSSDIARCIGAVPGWAAHLNAERVPMPGKDGATTAR